MLLVRRTMLPVALLVLIALAAGCSKKDEDPVEVVTELSQEEADDVAQHFTALTARNLGGSALRAFLTVSLPLAAPGIMASAIFVFLESLDEFTGTFFVGVPDVITLPLLMFTASIAGNYQIAAITALVLLVPSVVFMLFIERFLKADVMSKIGA